MNNEELIKKIRKFFEEESINKSNNLKVFSDDVVTMAYQKMTANIQDLIQSEEDPMVISELLKNYIEITKLIDEKDLPRQQMLLKLFEQLNKYEQSRYF